MCVPKLCAKYICERRRKKREESEREIDNFEFCVLFVVFCLLVLNYTEKKPAEI
jgi:hypothetical protein